MSITNLLAQGFNPLPAEIQQNALMAGQQMQERRMRNALLQQQMQAAQEDRAAQQRNALMMQEAISAIPSPQMQASQRALAGGGGPTVANAARMPAVDPRLQALHGMMRAGAVKPTDYINEALPKSEPVKLGKDDRLLKRGADGAYTELVGAAPKEQALPPGMRMGANGPEWIPGYLEGKTQVARAGASSVNVNTAKPLLSEVAGGLGKQIDSTLAQARAATGAIETARTLMQAVDSGKVVAGPGASFRVFGLQLGQMMGVGGKDGAETLANTRTAIQSMAQAELDAAQQMKGQGQITEAERDIIRRAAAGSVDNMTAPEIRLLAQTMDKMARVKIKSHNQNFEALKRMPGTEPLLPFYQVPEPPAYTPQSEKPVRRYNPATGRIE